MLLFGRTGRIPAARQPHVAGSTDLEHSVSTDGSSGVLLAPPGEAGDLQGGPVGTSLSGSENTLEPLCVLCHIPGNSVCSVLPDLELEHMVPGRVVLRYL